MATPRELVAMVSRALKVSEGTVVQHDRSLSLAGLRTMAGRGRAAARVTYQDASNLLIAVAGSRNVKDSVETAKAYAELRPENVIGVSQPEQIKKQIPSLVFGEALTWLLQDMVVDEDFHKAAWEPHTIVTLQGPVMPSAHIQITLGGATAHFYYGETALRVIAAGLRWTASFDQLSMIPIARLIHGGKPSCRWI